MADEARSLKAYGELPESIRVNETDTFDEERGENDECAAPPLLPCCAPQATDARVFRPGSSTSVRAAKTTFARVPC